MTSLLHAKRFRTKIYLLLWKWKVFLFFTADFSWFFAVALQIFLDFSQ